MGVDLAGPTLVGCDFQADSIADALARSGHIAAAPTLYICEGLLVYLDQHAGHELLSGIASRAAPGSTLAVTLAIHASDATSAEVVAAANARRRTAAAEPWRTILTADEHLAMLAEAGWTVTAVAVSPVASDDVGHARRASLLVTAESGSAITVTCAGRTFSSIWFEPVGARRNLCAGTADNY